MSHLIPHKVDVSAGDGPRYGLMAERPKKHWLPPVSALRRSASMPGSPAATSSKSSLQPRDATATHWRQEAQSYLLSANALEGGLGQRACAMASTLVARSASEQLETAMSVGEPRVIRQGVRYAICRGKLAGDPLVRRAQAMLAEFEKTAWLCRDGIAEGNMLKLQRGVRSAAQLPLKVASDPCIREARDAVAIWAPLEPYLRRLDNCLHEGVRKATLEWVHTLEARVLNPTWEDAATRELARLSDCSEALEQVLTVPSVRLCYACAPWRDRNRLIAMAQRRLSELGLDPTSLRMRSARCAASPGAPIEDGPSDALGVAIAVEGTDVDLARLKAINLDQQEPTALGWTPSLESNECRGLRLEDLRRRLALALVRNGAAETRVAGVGECTRANAAAPTSPKSQLEVPAWWAVVPARDPPLPLFDPHRDPLGCQGVKLV